MTAMESLCAKIAPLNLYNTEDGTHIYNELYCYSIALDEYRALLDEALNECFISTSSTYGLENRELLVGNVKDIYTAEKRREMLVFRNMLGENDFTKEGLDKFFLSFGITEYQVLEIPGEREITIYVSGDYSNVEKKWIEKQIKLVLPAHLKNNIYFQGIAWKDIENRNLTFLEMDNKNYTWNMINNLE